jgi:hypothetical protein
MVIPFLVRGQGLDVRVCGAERLYRTIIGYNKEILQK